MSKNIHFLADPPVLVTLTFFIREQIQEIVHVSGFQQGLFSIRADISGVICMYTWDTFLGHPVVIKVYISLNYTLNFLPINPLQAIYLHIFGSYVILEIRL